MIRTVVVDDKALVRCGFRLTLNAAEHIDVVAAVTGGKALTAVREHEPGVVLLDIRMPDVDGLTVLRQLCAPPALERPAIAMLTTLDTDEYILTALGAGAAGFPLKDTDPAQLAQAVRTLAAGGVVLLPKATRFLLSGHPGTGEADQAIARIERLSERERVVRVLVAERLPIAGIGDRLRLSSGTVKDHVSAILTKLWVGGRVQAVLLARWAGLLGQRAGLLGQR
ncbi:DNA-binding response regulator [Streptomyces sp. WAC 06783]|uniref:response regulator n=1 Tax=Streptomyces sp. WAC 06783 TaxID=2203211 RepID=UPI000F746EE1|nr:response regulator transcription factor [Streptomyces sp. WAC 06783]RSO05657.1 DNA-binding response regulator [Streptomyces sp. WAC 06783]